MDERSFPPIARWVVITGWVLSVIPSLLFIMSAIVKFIQPGPDFAKGLAESGWTSEGMFRLGFVEIGCTLIYLFPRTSILGAMLLTAYLGGAVVTNLMAGQTILIPIGVGVLVWGGLYLRDRRIRRLVPFTSK